MSVRRALLVVGALALAAFLALVGGTAALQWWSVRSSADPDAATVATTCSPGRGFVVTAVEERSWGWVVRMAPWRVAYFGAEDTLGGNPNVYVVREGDALVPWFSGSVPPVDPVTKVELTAAGAQNPWEADIVLALAEKREPYVAERCSSRRF